MPLFKFTGFQPTFINGLRDADGYQLGWINPGDVIEGPEAPNSFFTPVDPPSDPPAGSGESSTDTSSGEGDPVNPQQDPAPTPQPAPQVSQWAANPATTAVVH